ncbi:hypothetical protein, partial [Serratia marcescens]|uniref:hypothetical protein n=1 Tax=Serratia marcescens TaxID=615 RepID=UPI001BCAEEE8
VFLGIAVTFRDKTLSGMCKEVNEHDQRSSHGKQTDHFHCYTLELAGERPNYPTYRLKRSILARLSA